MDFSEMTLEEVLRAYSSVKGHRTRCKREINSLIDMLKVSTGGLKTPAPSTEDAEPVTLIPVGLPCLERHVESAVFGSL